MIPMPGHDDVIERAIVFIHEARTRHGSGLALEVGEYLFVNVFACDAAYVVRKDRTKPDSLAKIARAVGYTHTTLTRWVKMAIVMRRLRALGIDPDIAQKKLAALFPVEDPDALAALAEWTRPMRASDVNRLVRDLAEHLASGGTLESFGEKTRDEPRRKPVDPHRRHRTADDLIVPRLVVLLTDATWAAPSSRTPPMPPSPTSRRGSGTSSTSAPWTTPTPSSPSPAGSPPTTSAPTTSPP